MSIAAAIVWIAIVVSARKLIPLGIAAFVITGLTGAFQILPMLEYGRLAVRWTGSETPQRLGETIPYEEHVKHSLKPISLIGIVVPGVEQSAYGSFTGAVAFSLAALGVVLGWRERQVRWLAMMALGGILFALGPNSVFHGVIYALVPMVDKARVPAAGLIIFMLGLAPLAAFGVDWIPRAESGRTTRLTGWILSGFAAVLALASLFFYAANKTPEISDNRMVISAFVAVFFTALLAGVRANAISPRAGVACILLLVLFELGNVTDYWLPVAGDLKQSPYLYKLAQHSDIAQYIKNQGEFARFIYDSDEIPYNIGDWYGIESYNAYDVSIPANLWDIDAFSQRVEDILGIRYYVGKKPSRDGQYQVFQGQLVNVYENPNAFPRAWSVHESQKVFGMKRARDVLGDQGFDARNMVFTVDENPPRLKSCTGDEISMPHHEPNYLRIDAQMQCRGMVILTDAWFPGWQATVDGKRAKIEKAYGFVRGVVVEQGKHTVEMRYRPWSVYVGGALSLLAAGIVIVIGRRQSL